MLVQLTFDLPPTLNDMLCVARRNRFAAASDKKKWTAYAQSIAAQSQVVFPDKVWMTFNWYVKRRARDNDNVAAAKKYLLDGMCAAGMLKNDNMTIVQSPFIEWFDICKEREYVVVTINDRPIYEITAIVQ